MRLMIYVLRKGTKQFSNNFQQRAEHMPTKCQTYPNQPQTASEQVPVQVPKLIQTSSGTIPNKFWKGST